MKDSKVNNNYFTQPDRRPPKSADKGEIEKILSKYGSKLKFVSTADVAGAKIQLKTNSEHVFEWWNLNWFITDNTNIEGRVFVVRDVEGYDPHLFYDIKNRKILIVNSEYYGAAKSSGALALAGIILEERGGYPIHGACVGIEKNGINEGVVMIAPTGTGKTTQTHEILYSMRNSKVHSDDYVFIFFDGPDGAPRVVATEKQLYMRTDIAEQHPTFTHLFRNLPLENVITIKEKCSQKHSDKERMGPCYKEVVFNSSKCIFEDNDRCYWSYGNSRVMFARSLFPMQVRDENGYLHEVPKGDESVINNAIVKYVFFLTRDNNTPPAKKLEVDEAIEVLKIGKYQIRPGAGPEEMWGKDGFEPFYNPYPVEMDKAKQEKFFRELFKKGVLFYMLNTGSYEGLKITPHQTHTYIRRIIE